MKRLLYLLLSATALSSTAAPLFRNPLPIATNGGGEILKADFNADTHADVLLTNNDGFAVYLANGTGPFAPGIVTPLAQPSEIAVGDLNGDGRPDVVTSRWDSADITVLLGNGDGSFTRATPLASGLAGALAIADFNGDGFADVAIGGQDPHSSSNVLAVHFGNGTGSFSSSATSVTGDFARSLAPADLNHDGKMDLILENTFGTRVYLGSGSGTFTFTSGLAQGGVAVGDFDRDGKRDLAIAAGGTHDYFVEVALGDGDGLFSRRTRYVTGYAADSIVAADVDEDGNLDLLTAGKAGSTVSVLRGKPDGTFHLAEHFLSGPGAGMLVSADFDRDGNLDVLTVDSHPSELRALSFVRGNGDGSFRTYRAFHTTEEIIRGAGRDVSGGIAADMNGDGKPDVVIAQDGGEGQNLRVHVGVMLNDGSGKLAAPLFTPTAIHGFGTWLKLAVGDVNNDGDRDVFLLDDSGSFGPETVLLLGNGAGGLAAPIAVTIPRGGYPTLGHVNGDANLDLFVSNGGVHPGNGDGTFGAAIATFDDGGDIIAGDLNGDGKLDLAAKRFNGVRVRMNDGTGTFVPIDVLTRELHTLVAIGDFDGDGKNDILATTFTGTFTLPGNGDGTFRAPVETTITPVPNHPSAGPTTTADFDGDGNLDVAFASSVYHGNGDGTFRSRSRFRTSLVTAVSAADMDASGSPDLIITKRDADDVGVLLTRTTPDPTAPSNTALTADMATASHGQTVTFTALVSGAFPLGGVVVFKMDGKPIALIEPVDGQATLRYAVSTGQHSVEATYTGDENLLPSSAATSLSVAKVTVKLVLTGGPNPQPQNRGVRVSAGLGISFFSNSVAPPTGTIVIRPGDLTPVEVPASVFNQIIEVRTLPVGEHTISAEYAGDDNYEPASASYVQKITRPIPSLALSVSPQGTLLAGTPVQLRAHFLNSGTMTGTITFFVDDEPAQTLPLQDGSATLERPLPWGRYSISVQYSGDETWAPVTASTFRTVWLPAGSTPAIRATGLSWGVDLRWSPVVDAISYTVWQKSTLAGPWEAVHTASPTSPGLQLQIPTMTSRLYAVTANGEGVVSPMSAPDLATAIAFDWNLAPGAPVKALHLKELRNAIAAVRKFAGLSSVTHSNTVGAGSPIFAADLTELRNAIDPARAAIGLPAISFTDPALTAGSSLLKAVHFLELRAATD